MAIQMPMSVHEIESVVSAAISAPSVLNTQPWLFEARGDRIDVRLDRRRRLGAVDPDDRELCISCGAALFNLRVALAAMGKAVEVTVRPDRSDDGLLASVVIEGDKVPSEAELLLSQAIPRRRTSRFPFSVTAISEDVRGRLVAAAAAEGALLHFPSAWEYDDLIGLMHRADSEQRFDEAVRTEQARWVGIEADGGLPRRVLGPRAKDPSSTMREFTPGRGVPRDVAAFEKDPVLAVLSTSRDEQDDWVAAGQALELVLLTATSEGLVASLNTQPIEVTSVRWLVRDPLGPISHPQVVIRLGYGPRGPASPRRPVRDVLMLHPLDEVGTSGRGVVVPD